MSYAFGTQTRRRYVSSYENMSLELDLGILSRYIDMIVWATSVGKLTGAERRIVQPR